MRKRLIRVGSPEVPILFDPVLPDVAGGFPLEVAFVREKCGAIAWALWLFWRHLRHEDGIVWHSERWLAKHLKVDGTPVGPHRAKYAVKRLRQLRLVASLGRKPVVERRADGAEIWHKPYHHQVLGSFARARNGEDCIAVPMATYEAILGASKHGGNRRLTKKEQKEIAQRNQFELFKNRTKEPKVQKGRLDRLVLNPESSVEAQLAAQNLELQNEKYIAPKAKKGRSKRPNVWRNSPIVEVSPPVPAPLEMPIPALSHDNNHGMVAAADDDFPLLSDNNSNIGKPNNSADRTEQDAPTHPSRRPYKIFFEDLSDPVSFLTKRNLAPFPADEERPLGGSPLTTPTLEPEDLDFKLEEIPLVQNSEPIQNLASAIASPAGSFETSPGAQAFPAGPEGACSSEKAAFGSNLLLSQLTENKVLVNSAMISESPSKRQIPRVSFESLRAKFRFIPQHPRLQIVPAETPGAEYLDKNLSDHGKAHVLAKTISECIKTTFGANYYAPFSAAVLRDIRYSKHFKALVDASNALIEHSLRPAEWIMFCIAFVKQYSKAKNTPPSLRFILSLKVIEKYQNWASREWSGVFGAVRVSHTKSEEFLTRYWLRFESEIIKLGPACTEEQVRAVMDAYWDPKLVTQKILEANRLRFEAQEHARRRLDRGEWIWNVRV